MEKILQHLLVIVTLWFCSVPSERVPSPVAGKDFIWEEECSSQEGSGHPHGVTKVTIMLCTALRGGGRSSSKQCCPF